jgi:molybdenum cofactor cytidylyltransferase
LIEEERIICLILAAGASSRMGGHPKALLPWGETTVLQHLLRQVKQAGLKTVVLVTGAHHEQLKPALASESISVCHNPHWDRGIGSSLSRGIGYLNSKFPMANAVLVLLSDQPLLTHEYLGLMLSEYAKFSEQMVVSGYGESEGVPAIFPRKYWDSLLKIAPERGASSFIKSKKPNFRILQPGKALMDIDTPEMYQLALKIAGLN